MEHSFTLFRFLPRIYRDAIFRHWLHMTGAAFVALTIGSYLAGILVPGLAENVYLGMTDAVQAAEVQTGKGGFSGLLLFFHNFRATAFTILYGLVPGLYLPALLLGLNTMGLGFVGAHCVNSGLPLFVYIAGVLPHGIFELSAMVLALSAGFYLCHCVTRRIRSKEKGIVRHAFSLTSQLLFLHIVPLLIIAALVEAYVTPSILRIITGT